MSFEFLGFFFYLKNIISFLSSKTFSGGGKKALDGTHNRLDCVHKFDDEYERRQRMPKKDGGSDSDVNSSWSTGIIILVVCLSVGSAACVCGIIGFWHLRKRTKKIDQILEESSLIREAITEVDIDPDVDVACPPPPEQVLLQAAERRRQMSLIGGNGGDAESSEGPPSHRRVGSSRFNPNRRPMSVQLQTLQSGSGPPLPGRPVSMKLAIKPIKMKHVRSKTMDQFRQNKQHAQKNAEILIQANINYTDGGSTTTAELINPKTGRPMSVRVGAPRSHGHGNLPQHPSMHLLNPAFDLESLSQQSNEEEEERMRKGKGKGKGKKRNDFLSTKQVAMPEQKNNKKSAGSRLLMGGGVEFE